MERSCVRVVGMGLVTLILGIAVGPVSAGDALPVASPDEPKASSLSMRKTAGYLDEVALDWTRSRKCGTCHTNYAYMISRPSLREVGSADAMQEIRAFYE